MPTVPGEGALRFAPGPRLNQLKGANTVLLSLRYPTRLNKAKLIEKIAELVKEKNWRGSATSGTNRTGKV